MHVGSFAAPTFSLRLLFFLSRHPTYSCACCVSIRPSIPYVRITSVSSSIRARNTRVQRSARVRACFASAYAHAGSYVQRTCVCECVYVHVHVYMEYTSQRRSLSVSGHAAHDIRRWGPCGHLISGDTRARASLLIVGPDR